MKTFYILLCVILTLFYTFKTVNSLTSRHTFLRNPLKIINDEVRGTKIIIQRKKRDGHEKIHNKDKKLLIRTRRFNEDYTKDNVEAAKIRSLIFNSQSNIVRTPRQSLEEKQTMQKLDQSIEDKWKLEQSAHAYERKKRIAVSKAVRKPYFIPFNAVAARVMVPARSETRSPGISSMAKQQHRSHIGEEKRDISTLTAVVPYDTRDI